MPKDKKARNFGARAVDRTAGRRKVTVKRSVPSSPPNGVTFSMVSTGMDRTTSPSLSLALTTDSMDTEKTTSPSLSLTPSTGSTDSMDTERAVKRKRGDTAERDPSASKKRKPPSAEETRAWAHGDLHPSWNWRAKELSLSGRPLKQFTNGREGAHTVSWTAVDRAVQANLSGSANAAEAIGRLKAVFKHLNKAPLTTVDPPADEALRTMQYTDVSVRSIAARNLTDSLHSAADEQGLDKALKDFLVWRNTLPFAAIPGPAPGAAEGTYAPRLARHDALLRSAPKDFTVNESTRQEMGFAAWKLVDTARLLDELSAQAEVYDFGTGPARAVPLYDPDTAEATFAAVVATLLDEVSRWAPLSLRAAGLAGPDGDAAKGAKAITDHLKGYLDTELARAKEKDGKNEAQYKRQSTTGSYDHAATRVWQARVKWFGEHQDKVQEQLQKWMSWIGKYGFDPTPVVRTRKPLTVTADFSSGALRLTISGRPESPFSGSEGSHVTAWALEKLATLNRLGGMDKAKVKTELKTMLKECNSSPAAGLVGLLPDEERDLTAARMNAAKDRFAAAVKELDTTSDLGRVVATAVREYQNYRNALPFATTFAGSRSGHGEGAVLKNSDTVSRGALSNALFDKESLEEEIDNLELQEHRDTIFTARRQEHNRQFGWAFPK
ncbi:hypothetical protein ACFXDH_13920 [Streptomyces sp. NPDC059467]|uniref:hypothetical protein n=1 Tax=Streptomyces sp. NPDC059467 TaxID=3346844 RepID=UPI0036A0C952